MEYVSVVVECEEAPRFIGKADNYGSLEMWSPLRRDKISLSLENHGISYREII